MTLLFCGDTHGSLAHLAREPVCTAPDATLIHLGDFELAEPLSAALPAVLHPRFWWIPGNHDFDTQALRDRLFLDPLKAHCLHLKIITLGGYRAAGLGGVFKGRVWRPPARPGFAAERGPRQIRRQIKGSPGDKDLLLQSAIWPTEVQRLARQRADILVCHEAPSCHRHGFEAIDALAVSLGARYIVHGHHHTDYRATVHGGAISVIGVGLRGVASLQGQVLPSLKSRRVP